MISAETSSFIFYPQNLQIKSLLFYLKWAKTHKMSKKFSGVNPGHPLKRKGEGKEEDMKPGEVGREGWKE
jgi:hypothetical protein